MNAKQKSITVDIYPDGSSKVEAHNFNGVGCAKATQAIELALAGNDADNRDQRKKPDFFATHSGANTLKR